MNRGVGPTAIVATTLLVAGSTRCTEFAAVFVTHTAPNPKVAAYVDGSTGMRAVTELVSPSSRDNTPVESLTTHTAPAPNARLISPFGSAMPVLTAAVRSPVDRLIRYSVRSLQLIAQIDPAP